jgi:hypothetical protein
VSRCRPPLALDVADQKLFEGAPQLQHWSLQVKPLVPASPPQVESELRASRLEVEPAVGELLVG